MRNKIDVPDGSRRKFLSWTIGAGAALGLRPWKIFEVGEDLFGTAFAEEAACMRANRFVGCVLGDGGFAWMTQLFPFRDQATRGGSTSFYATGSATEQEVGAGDHPFSLSPDAPRFGARKMTGFVCGRNEAHTRQPSSVTALDARSSLFAAVTAIQSSSPAVIPAITVGDVPFGSAPGAATPASVPNSGGIVELFGSASSQDGGPLSLRGDAGLFEAAFKANLGLRRAAGIPNYAGALRTAKIASAVVGKNLADRLRPMPEDLMRYGVDESLPRVAEIARTLITTVKAFRMGLTHTVIFPAMDDDPHGAFAADNGPSTLATIAALGRAWTAFVADLSTEPDPTCPGTSMADNTVIAWIGDTGKEPYIRDVWPDSTPRAANWMYALGAGFLKGGWFGDLRGDGTVEAWDPTTGANTSGNGVLDLPALAAPASAAVLHAVAKGDARRVQDFYRGPSIQGVIAR